MAREISENSHQEIVCRPCGINSVQIVCQAHPTGQGTSVFRNFFNGKKIKKNTGHRVVVGRNRNFVYNATLGTNNDNALGVSKP